METFRYFFSSSEDTLGVVAARYNTTESRIQALSKTDGQAWADHWLFTIDHTSVIRDGDVLVVPIPEPLPSLPAGADWKEYPTPQGATVFTIIDALKSAE